MNFTIILYTILTLGHGAAAYRMYILGKSSSSGLVEITLPIMVICLLIWFIHRINNYSKRRKDGHIKNT